MRCADSRSRPGGGALPAVAPGTGRAVPRQSTRPRHRSPRRRVAPAAARPHLVAADVRSADQPRPVLAGSSGLGKAGKLGAQQGAERTAALVSRRVAAHQQRRPGEFLLRGRPVDRSLGLAPLRGRSSGCCQGGLPGRAAASAGAAPRASPDAPPSLGRRRRARFEAAPPSPEPAPPRWPPSAAPRLERPAPLGRHQHRLRPPRPQRGPTRML